MGSLATVALLLSLFVIPVFSNHLERSTRDFVSSRRSRLPQDLSRRDADTQGFNSSFSVVKNSGVCETTPGVGQISGYIEVGVDMSMVSRFVLSLGFVHWDLEWIYAWPVTGALCEAAGRCI